jgi:hypothetical protein
VINAVEYLVIDGIPLSTPAWQTPELSDLLSTPEMRGDDMLVPYGDGVRPYPRRPTVTKASVTLQVVGDTAPDGTAHASARTGLRLNIEALSWLASSAGVDGQGTRLAELHLEGATRTGRVHILRMRFARQGHNFADGQLELSLPSGALR